MVFFVGNILIPDKNSLWSIIDIIPLSQNDHGQLLKHYQKTISEKHINWWIDGLTPILDNSTMQWTNNRMKFKNIKYLASRLLAFNPENRITASEALALPIWNYAKYKGLGSQKEPRMTFFEIYGTDWDAEQWKRMLTIFTKLHNIKVKIFVEDKKFSKNV